MNLFRPTKFSLWDTTESALPRVYYGGGKSQTSTSQVSIPPEVLAQYQNVNSIANQVAQTPFKQYSADPNAFVAPLTTTQQAGIVGTNEYSNEAQPFYQTASNQNQTSTAAGQGLIGAAAPINQSSTAAGQGSLATAQGATAAAGSPISAGQIGRYMSPYNQNVINQESQLLQQQYNQAQSGQLGNAINQGAFGGSRSAVTAANLQQQQALAYGNTMAGLLNQNYSQALGEANTEQQAGLQAANQYGTLGATSAQLGQTEANNLANYGSAYGQLGQAGATNEANIGSGAQAAGLAGAQAQLTAGQAQQQTEQAGLTALYNQFLQQQSYPFQTTQFLANIAEGTGALSGSTTTSNQPAPYFSDERLKEDIEPIGKTYDGLNIIKFRYKGDKQPQIGLSAQDVEKKHPEAVGLAGGYKTVDYDAATRDAAAHGAREGGLVVPIPAGLRRHYDMGGYAGLSPNAAWAAGFNLDPSYLQAQEAAYGNAPWGNAGPVTGSAPYGGKSHVPPSAGGTHASLSVAKPPQSQGGSGLQQLAGGLGQLEKLGQSGKSLFNNVKGAVPGLGGSNASSAPPQQAAGLGIGSGEQGPPPPSKNQPVEANPAPPQPTDASAGPVVSNDNSGLGAADSVGTPDLSGLDELGDDLFAKRGGLIHRDSGGPTYNQPTDDTSEDQSGGGDIPYDSGTGAGGLDIPDDQSNNKLAVAQPPQQSGGGGGGFNPLGLLGPVLGIFGLASGGRVGLAGGGSPDDMPMPAMDDPSVFDQGNDPGLAKHQWGPTHAGGSPSGPIIDNNDAGVPFPKPAPKSEGLAPASRDIMVHKAAPATAAAAPAPASKAGLNPDAPAPEAQSVQMVQDMGSGQHLTQPGEVLTQDNPGGVGDWINKNQGLLIPALHGLGTMASSNSRYLGSAILQGLGGAADSYENVQNEMQGRAGNQPIITQRQNDALQSDLGAWQSYVAQTGVNMSFPQFEKMKASGRLATNPAQNGQNGGQNRPYVVNPGQYSYTVQEKNNGVGPDGVPLSQNPSYIANWAAHNRGVHSEFINGQVEQANHQAGQIAGQGYTYDANGNQVLPGGYNSRVIGQAQPITQADQAKAFQDRGINFAAEAGRNMSLFDELGGIYQKFQAGPTAGWRSDIARFANEFDPQGNYPFLHNIPAGDDAANYDKARKDIAQLTVGRLSELPGGAPRATMEELNQFAADPHLSPAALRDIIVRGKASVAQASDYYQGFDPYSNGSNGVAAYTNNFYYKTNPYEKYRQQFEKATPAFAGESPTNSPEMGGGNSKTPQPGFISKGWQFKGGDPSNRANWVKAPAAGELTD